MAEMNKYGKTPLDLAKKPTRQAIDQYLESQKSPSSVRTQINSKENLQRQKSLSNYGTQITIFVVIITVISIGLYFAIKKYRLNKRNKDSLQP